MVHLALFERLDHLEAGIAALDVLHLPAGQAAGLDVVQNARVGGIHAGQARILAVQRGGFLLGEHKPFFVHPLFHIGKGDDRVDRVILAHIARLIDLCKAGADKDHLSFRILMLDVAAMRHHGGDDGRQELDQFRIMLFDQIIDRRTAGGDDVIHLVLLGDADHLVADERRADRGFTNLGKAELLQRADHLHGVVHLECAVERGGKRGHHALAAIQHALHGLKLAFRLLRALGTDAHAGAAGDAQIRHDFRLPGGEADGLHRTVAQTFVAVFTVRLLGLNRAH